MYINGYEVGKGFISMTSSGVEGGGSPMDMFTSEQDVMIRPCQAMHAMDTYIV